MRSPKKLLSFVIAFSLLLSTNSSICLAASLPATVASLSITEQAFALPDAKVGLKYEYQFQSEGGLAPLTWKVLQGSLPPGLNFGCQWQASRHSIPGSTRRLCLSGRGLRLFQRTATIHTAFSAYGSGCATPHRYHAKLKDPHKSSEFGTGHQQFKRRRDFYNKRRKRPQ